MKKLPSSVKKKIEEVAPKLPVLAEMLPRNNNDEDTEPVPVTEIAIKTGRQWLQENPNLTAKGEPLDPDKRYKFRLMKAVNHAKVLRKECLKLATEAEQINFINQYTIDVIDLAEITTFEPQYIL